MGEDEQFVHSGRLFKRGKWIGKWKPYHFGITFDGNLVYWASGDALEPGKERGTIPLDNATLTTGTVGDRPFSFRVQTMDPPRILELACESNRSLREWRHCLGLAARHHEARLVASPRSAQRKGSALAQLEAPSPPPRGLLALGTFLMSGEESHGANAPAYGRLYINVVQARGLPAADYNPML